jgi:hypothetical protein
MNNGSRRSRFHRQAFEARKEKAMGGERQEDRDLPLGDERIEQEAEKNRKEMDEVPPHGTDPLHEGP